MSGHAGTGCRVQRTTGRKCSAPKPPTQEASHPSLRARVANHRRIRNVYETLCLRSCSRNVEKGLRSYDAVENERYTSSHSTNPEPRRHVVAHFTYILATKEDNKTVEGRRNVFLLIDGIPGATPCDLTSSFSMRHNLSVRVITAQKINGMLQGVGPAISLCVVVHRGRVESDDIDVKGCLGTTG